jgi:DNA-dependent metalloprotease WSS1
MGLFSKTGPASTPETSPNPLISTYTHLTLFEGADEALKLLHRLASMVRPIMSKRNWKIGTLAEFYPDFAQLQGTRRNYLG